jgi:hypothetical protein
MSETKTVVCLMNTRRHGSYAIAGVDPGSGSWLRFVGSGLYGGIAEAEQTLADGSRPGPFDVLEIPVAEAVRDQGRADTWRITGEPWRRSETIDGAERRALLERLVTEQAVFGTNEASFSPWSLVERGLPPIAIIRPQSLLWIKGLRGDQPRLVAAFLHAGVRQRLPVVDRALLSRFADAEMGQFVANDGVDTFLVITSEPLGDEHWKLVSAVLELPRDGSGHA